MAGTRSAAILAATLGVALAGGCGSEPREERARRAAIERLDIAADSETIEPAGKSKPIEKIGRPDPFVPYVRRVVWPPPRTRIVDVVPAVFTDAARRPTPVGDGHRRRASGVRWNGTAAAIYERDGEAFVVSVGDVVGPPDEEETIIAIGREWLTVRDRDRVQRRVALDLRTHPGWRRMVGN